MKNKIKKFIKPAVVIIGVIILAYFGLKTAQLGAAKPVCPAQTTSIISAATDAAATCTQELTRWNNQFARKGFFTLVGLFLVMVVLIPKKKRWITKITFSSGLVALIIHHLLSDGKITSIAEQGMVISYFWIFMAFIVKGSGMGCTIWRWKILLEGQGFKIPLKHLVESFLIGRFIGSFAPGTSGLDGYRAYDISRYTGKVARSISVIVVEKFIGFLVLGTLLLAAVPLGDRLFKEHDVNSTAILIMGLLFFGMMLASITLLFRPNIIRFFISKLIPSNLPIRKPIDKALASVTVYEKKKMHLLKAVITGFGVHLCTIGMYFCTSRAIGQFVDSGDLFVTSALMIGATILPLSIAGIGMREGVFAFLLGPLAAIYAFGGYLVGELISLIGGPVWLKRRTDYYEVMKKQRGKVNEDVEDFIEDEEIKGDDLNTNVLKKKDVNILRHVLDGFGAGLIAGLAIALIDSLRLGIIGNGVDMSLPWYGSLLYGPFVGILGAAFGLFTAIVHKFSGLGQISRNKFTSFTGLMLFSVFFIAIGFFFFKRDVFGEKAGLLALEMMGALLGLIVTAIIVSVAVGFLYRRIFSGRREQYTKLRYSIAFYVFVTLILAVSGLVSGKSDKTLNNTNTSAKEKLSQPNVLLVMVDTLRADYVGVYKENDLTPHLDALAKDGVTYLNTFAQASWTRPSVATILTGRYPSSHTSIYKGSVIPDEVTTLAEVMSDRGYQSFGIVTNYNLAEFFNFHRGFSYYKYLLPNLPLWANDVQSKLIFIEVFKKISAKFAGSKETPADYYVTGDIVTKKAVEKLKTRDKSKPFFMFLSYMDPHDPYFRHPFDGYGISRRANHKPGLDKIDEMKSLYTGEVKYWDKQFGKLVSELKNMDLYDNTVIVVVSDHGEEFGEHGGFWHGTTLYDEQLKVVNIVKYHKSSGFDTGLKISDWARLLDVAPMILGTVGLNIPKEMQGKHILDSARTPVFAEEDHEGNVLHSIRFMEKSREIKLITANKNNPRGLKEFELYDTHKDPQELEDISSSKEVMSLSIKKLDNMKTSARKGAAAKVSTELSEEAKKQLKQLGYMK